MENSEDDFCARSKLEFLTASDPAVRRNMMRHTAAFRILLTGRKEDSEDLKIVIGAGFGMSDASELKYQSSTRADRNDRLYLRFDVDDACGPSDGLGLIRMEGEQVPLYGQCRLWSPASGGRPVIIFLHEGNCGYFAYRPRKTLMRVDRLPAEDLTPGFLRATAQVAKLVASERLRVVPEPYMFMQSKPGSSHDDGFIGFRLLS